MRSPAPRLRERADSPMPARTASLSRQTRETQVDLALHLDETLAGSVQTGSGFLDHMLDLFRVHGGFGLTIACRGDTQIDMHHSTEDIAICLGSALQQALGQEQIVDLTVTIGFYNAVVRVLATLQIDVEDDYMPYLAQFPLPT